MKKLYIFSFLLIYFLQIQSYKCPELSLAQKRMIARGLVATGCMSAISILMYFFRPSNLDGIDYFAQ